MNLKEYRRRRANLRSYRYNLPAYVLMGGLLALMIVLFFLKVASPWIYLPMILFVPLVAFTWSDDKERVNIQTEFQAYVRSLEGQVLSYKRIIIDAQTRKHEAEVEIAKRMTSAVSP